MSRLMLLTGGFVLLLLASCNGTIQDTEKEIISLGDEVSGKPYSPAIRSGNTLYVSGQIAINPSSGKMIEGGIEEQTVQCLENLKALVEKAGFSMSDVVKCNVLLDTISYYGPMNDIYIRYFPEVPPARKAYSVESLPLGALVEIDAIAVLARN